MQHEHLIALIESELLKVREARPCRVDSDDAQREATARRLDDFHCHMPTAKFLYVPTRDLWPGESVNSAVKDWPDDPRKPGRKMAPSKWLQKMRPIHQLTWAPDEAQVIEDRVIDTGGWTEYKGERVFNLYRPPIVQPGDPSDVAPWLEHLRTLYPAEWEHIVFWFAQRVQQPGRKVNHAIVLGGAQGVGKDTLLEPLKLGVGPWNCHEISPGQMLGRFNGWAKSVIVRVSEARDLGDVDRLAFYDHSKAYIAAPPDVIRVDEKNLREHYVVNVMGVIITTNHKTDGIYLPGDDRRHFVAWSDATKDDFPPGYWQRLWAWYERGGLANVVAYLHRVDLAGFDPKAPPPQTPAFQAIVSAGQSPEDSELRDVLDYLRHPDALTLETIVVAGRALGLSEMADELADRRNRRKVPYKLERAGYVPVRNPDAADGYWKVGGRRQAVYCRKAATMAARIHAAKSLR